MLGSVENKQVVAVTLDNRALVSPALPAAAAPQHHDGDAGSNTLPSRGGICASRYQSTCLHVQA